MERTKFTYIYIEIKISRTSRRISNKICTNYPWVKGIINCSNTGLCVKGRITTKMQIRGGVI
jgi:hypothetical protein